VERLREMLRDHGAATVVGQPGRFGPVTACSLRAFQRGQGLPETGETDAATWRALSAPAPAGVPVRGW
jgi:peptidoglycan hydrolase-like protein with peptidoglycan-binding domain